MSEVDQNTDAPVVIASSAVTGPVRAAIIGIFLIILMGALYLAAGFLIPVALALLLSLVLSPVVRAFTRWSVPAPLSAALIVFVFVSSLFFAAFFLATPVASWLAAAPATLNELQFKLNDILRPLRVVEQATETVGDMASGGDPTVQEVVVQNPGLLSQVATAGPELLASTGLTLFLLYFLLASGDLFQAKLVKVLPTLSDKKKGLRIARDVEHQVSGYLFTITLINIGLGVAIGIAMFLLGMPNPVLWGASAALLNFIPYLGNIAGAALVALAAFATFDSLWDAVPVAAAYIGISLIESNVVTPMLVSRRLELNAVVVLVSVAFWGWLWGIIGAIIAVPILVLLKVLADNIEGMHGLGEFLAARDHPVAEPAPPPAGAPSENAIPK